MESTGHLLWCWTSHQVDLAAKKPITWNITKEETQTHWNRGTANETIHLTLKMAVSQVGKNTAHHFANKECCLPTQPSASVAISNGAPWGGGSRCRKLILAPCSNDRISKTDVSQPRLLRPPMHRRALQSRAASWLFFVISGHVLIFHYVVFGFIFSQQKPSYPGSLLAL